MSYLALEDVRELHVEITNICNAACPMCARNDFGYGVSPNPGLTGWKVGDAELAFSTDLPNLEKVYFCGTHGDPLASDYLYDAVAVCKSRGLQVEVFTNGSLRPESWWRGFTELLDQNDVIVFGVDGIETNHLYRQNTNIDRILHNMKICCESAASVQWDFLAFKHNEHELEECRSMAKQLGVKKFRIRKTARWHMNGGKPFPVRNKAGEVTHHLEKPNDPDLVHPDAQRIVDIRKKDQVEYKISCIYKNASKIYINCRLQVFPCCYISSDNEQLWLNADASKLQVPLDDFSLRDRSWHDILQHPFYTRELLDSFTNGKALRRCINTCGVVQYEANQNHVSV